MIGTEPLPYIVQLSIETPFVLFHISVTLCIAWNMWKGRAVLSSGFFVIYLVQSVCDLANYALTVVFYRMRNLNAIPGPVLHPRIRMLAVFLINSLFYFQCISHTAIAINRYMMIVHSNSYWTMIWKGRSVKILIVGMIIVAMLPAIPRLWCNVTETGDCAADNTVVGNSITPVVSTLSSLISISIELKTFADFRRLGETIRKTHREDFRLLVYAVCQFVGQMLMTLQTLATAVSLTFNLVEVRFYGKASHSVVIAVLCLSGPLCLFSTSKLLRQKYVQFYNVKIFDTMCTSIIVTPIASVVSRLSRH